LGAIVRPRTIAAAVVIAVAFVVAVPSLAGGQAPSDESSTTETTANTIDDVQVCDVSYPTLCIPPSPPDLNCGDVVERNFPVRPPDPHGFDGDHDGIGCEDDGEPTPPQSPPTPPPTEAEAPPAAPAAPVTAEPDFTG
jgi:hypothetical protein